MGRSTSVLLVAITLVVLALPSGAAAADVHLDLEGSGHLSSRVALTVSNGSALREAMDGNFVPIAGLLSSNASQQSAILAQIANAESTPFLNAYFGNRDGSVSANEVNLFSTLLVQESQLLPSGSFTSSPALGATLDGNAPTSISLVSLSFSGATGPAASEAPLGAEPELSFAFPYSGTSHTLSFSTNLTSVGFTLTPVLGEVNVTLQLPAGAAITGSSGFARAQTTNDPLGWQSPTFSASYEPSTHSQLSIEFGNAFPTGYVIVAAGSVAAVGVGVVLILRRRRRRTMPPPES